jgi:hypothetical protein
MVRRLAFGIAVGLLVAGTVTFAQGQDRTDKFEFSFAVPNQFIGACGPYQVVARYEIAVVVMDRRDKNGDLVQEISSWRTIAPTLYFLADYSDPPVRVNDNTVLGVPGESEIDRYVAAENQIHAQGAIFQATVPGYGRVFSQTGNILLDMSTSPLTVLTHRHHNQYWDHDVAVVCAYLLNGSGPRE